MRAGIVAYVLLVSAAAIATAVACGGAVAVNPAPDATAVVGDAGGGGTGDGPNSMATGNDSAVDAPGLFTPDAADAGSASFSCAPASSLFDGGCGDPMTDPHNCGGCGADCDGGACEAGACVATPAGVLATGQLAPIAIAADGTNVYWLTAGVTDNVGKLGTKVFGAQVLACAATGCGNHPTVLATYPPAGGLIAGGTPRSTAAIAVDTTRVYWTDQESVRSCAIIGCACTPTTIALGLSQPPGVTAAGCNVYWTEWAHGSPYTGTVSTCPTVGCGTVPTVLATGQGGPLALTADDQHVFWVDTYEDGGPIWECSPSGCDGGARIVANANGNPYAITSDATNLYWANAGAGTIVQCAKTDCQDTRVALASGRMRPSGIATDGVSVYWRDGPGDIYRCAVGGCGGNPTLVANATMNSGDFDQPIAVDGSRVYWTQERTVLDDDWIMSAPK
jgi:hypothetical protein